MQAIRPIAGEGPTRGGVVTAPVVRAGPGRALGIDIFCRVVDNLGDAGVCWRLARQFALEHGARVTLWIDRPEFIRKFIGASTPPRVAVEPWEEAANRFVARDAVLCTFGCELPQGVRRILATAGRAPVWANLEYLSAEPWIEGCHRLPSIKPDDGTIEWFFYPGFTPASGGLIRETGLGAERERFLRDERGDWLAAHGLASDPAALRISLFCYPQAPVAELLSELAGNTARPVHLLVAEDVADEPVRALLGHALAPGQRARAGALTITRFAFLDQPSYDRLLWSCELNFVRGEDSWIRAHWAHQPFIWQPYPQTERTHLAKLEAFLARMLAQPAQSGGPDAADMSTEPSLIIRSTMLGWNGAAPFRPAWQRFAGALPGLVPTYRQWSGKLAREPDLGAALHRFILDKL